MKISDKGEILQQVVIMHCAVVMNMLKCRLA
jgi:hypothetical protein